MGPSHGIPRLRDRLSAIVVPALGALALGVAMWSFAPRGARATVVDAAPGGAPFPVLAATPRFVVRGDASPDSAADLGDWLEQVADVFETEARDLGFDPRRPAAPLEVLFFASRADFVAFARDVDNVDASSMGGYYAPGPNRVALYDDRSTASFARALASMDSNEQAAAERDVRRATRRKAAHEAAHLLAYNTGVQSPGVDYPAWFTEGLAERVASRAMREPRAHAGGSPWQAFAKALLLGSTAGERYAGAHAAFEALAAHAPGAAARFEAARRASVRAALADATRDD